MLERNRRGGIYVCPPGRSEIMLESDVVINDRCLICKELYYTDTDKRMKDNWIYISQITSGKGINYQWFCLNCWLSIAGEEFVFALPEREE